MSEHEGENAPARAGSRPGADDDADLRSGLAGLAGLVTDGLRLEDVLARVATYAVDAVKGADGASVILHRPRGATTGVEAKAASHAFVEQIDEIQYAIVNEGPCITAAAEGRAIRSGSLGGDLRWAQFGPRVGRLRVNSVLALPLLLPPQVIGAINVYARSKDAFDDRAETIGTSFARPAAVAVHNAQVLTQTLALAEHLQIALRNRPIIDQAIGLIRGRTGVSAEEALSRLRTISQDEHRKINVIAQQMVDQAVHRAMSRGHT